MGIAGCWEVVEANGQLHCEEVEMMGTMGLLRNVVLEPAQRVVTLKVGGTNRASVAKVGVG